MTRTISTAVALTALASMALTAPSAQANDDRVRRGDCTRSAGWKLEVGADDGRLEVEGEVDSNRAGQTWRWRIVHNGAVAASGVRTTRAPSGSFEVSRTVANLRGTDTVTFRARNVRSGEVCRGTILF